MKNIIDILFQNKDIFVCGLTVCIVFVMTSSLKLADIRKLGCNFIGLFVVLKDVDNSCK